GMAMMGEDYPCKPMGTPAERRAEHAPYSDEVEDEEWDVPARQVHPQTMDEWSGRAPASPVLMNDGQYCQNGESATMGLYPTDVISNGEDTVLNVTGEIFTSQYGV
ncbi:hypothetical protein H4R20_004268, partial [Coemansia guatemalensis]